MINEPLTPETPPMTQREVKLTDSIVRKNETICSLKQELTVAEKENKRLHEGIEMLRSDNETQCRTLAEMHNETELDRNAVERND